METTERLSLPMLVPGQAQKELFHNEALLLLDAIVAGSVEEVARNDPPPSPMAGDCYLVGTAPSGEWSQHANHLAAFGSAGWRYVPPVVGMTIVFKADGMRATYLATGWEVGTVRASRMLIDGVQVIGSRSEAISNPIGGITVDSEARATLEEILVALRSHGLIAS